MMQEKDRIADIANFEKISSFAKKYGFINEKQESALLTKKRNQELEPKKRQALSTQDRNALRILRNMITSKPIEKTKELIIQVLKMPVIQGLIAEVDTKGILCYKCKTGTMIEATTSTWTKLPAYECILDHVPASVCINPKCKEAIFTDKTVKALELIFNLIETTINEIPQTINEKIETKYKQCPICQQLEIKAKTTFTYQNSISSLFHLKIKELPVQVYCPLCGYNELYPKTRIQIEKLNEQLEQKAIELLTIR